MKPGTWLLALEATTGPGSAALWCDGAPRGLSRAPAGADHAETHLLARVDEVLGQAGVDLSQVGAFAVAVGPGSFTGLRVALATVKGLAFGFAGPAVAVSSLVALAEAAGAEAGGGAGCLPLLDARRGELYGAWLRPDPGAATGWDARLPESVYAPAQLAAALAEGARPVGPGAALLDPPRPEAARVRGEADAVAAVAARCLAAGEGGRAADLLPRYLRRAQAEVLRTGQALESA